jgi:hypothetical protein
MSLFSRLAHLTHLAAPALALAIALVLCPAALRAQPVTYQGVLTGPAGPIVGDATIRARLFANPTGGTAIGPQLTATIVTADSGAFTLPLDFGPNAFSSGQPRYLELDVASPAGSTDFVTLAPRQPLTPAPQALGIAGIDITPAGPPIIDQAQDVEGGAAFGLGSEFWQSFTAGRTGNLVGVDLQVRQLGLNGTNPGIITVNVRSGVGLAGPILGTSTLVYDPLPPEQLTRIVRVTLPGINIAQGERYTLELLGQGFVRIAAFAIPGASGNNNGAPANYWFRTLVAEHAIINARSTRAIRASNADNAQNAVNSQNAVNAENAANAANAQNAVNAQNVPWLGLTGQPEVRTGNIGNNWQLIFNNTGISGFRGGLRLSDLGFFELTNNAASTTANFARLSSTGAWTTVSDARLKHDVSPLDPGDQLDRVLRLRPVSYVWNGTTRRDVGLIAQDVRGVLPELVEGDETREMLTVNYAQMSVAAVGAIQELNARHERELAAHERERAEMERERAALNARIDELMKRIEALEAQSPMLDVSRGEGR